MPVPTAIPVCPSLWAAAVPSDLGTEHSLTHTFLQQAPVPPGHCPSAVQVPVLLGVAWVCISGEAWLAGVLCLCVAGLTSKGAATAWPPRGAQLHLRLHEPLSPLHSHSLGSWVNSCPMQQCVSVRVSLQSCWGAEGVRTSIRLPVTGGCPLLSGQDTGCPSRSTSPCSDSWR